MDSQNDKQPEYHKTIIECPHPHGTVGEDDYGNYAGNRGFAALIDAGICLGIGAMVNAVLREALAIIACLCLIPAYWMFKEKLTPSGSIGKLLCGIKVVDYQTRAGITLTQSMKRALPLLAVGVSWLIVTAIGDTIKIRGIANVIVVSALVGGFMSAFTMVVAGVAGGNGQTRADMWAGTIVVPKKEKTAPTSCKPRPPSNPSPNSQK